MNNIASDNAVFFADICNEGWHIAHGRCFLCRRKGPIWENALIQQCTAFPDAECIDGGEIGEIANVLWVEPEYWKPLDLAPTDSPSDGLRIMGAIGAVCRFRGRPDQFELWDRLLVFCAGKTQREAVIEVNGW